MAEFVTGFLVEKIGNLLIEEVNLLSGVSEQVKQLQTELQRMQCFLKDADKRQDESAVVRNVVTEIREAAYDAEDIIETLAFKAASEKGGIQDVLKRYACLFNEGTSLHKAGHEIEAIKAKISKLTGSLQTYGINAINQGEGSCSMSERQWQLRRSYSHVVEDYIVGYEENVKELVTKLVNEENYSRVVSICGMGGSGKTTLAKMVYHHSDIKRHFESFAWAYVSQQCKTRYVWERILIQLISPSKEERDEILKMKDEELAKRLYQVLQAKRCLVILDDIWSTEAWDMISPAFPDLKKGSKILLTSRNREVALHVDLRGFIHEPQCLNEEESWELFRRKAFARRDPDFKINENMEQLGMEMVKRCSGLPLAIVVLGGLMATKDTPREWDMVHGQQSRVSDVLALSYHELPYQLKPCFLYLSHFPEDFEIPKTKLIHLWVAEGIVSHSHMQCDGGAETLEDVAERYLGDLINRCMVQVVARGQSGAVKTCRLHQMMRELCLSKAKQENFLHISCQQLGNESAELFPSTKESKSTSAGKIRRLAIYLDQGVTEFIPSELKENHHLRSVLYFHAKKRKMDSWKPMIPIFNNCKFLRSLDLEGIKGLKGKLPKEIGRLIQLRFLSLKNTKIRELPSSIGNLECLQTLNLQTLEKVSWESTVQIPNVLWKMERLGHLYLPKFCGTDELQLENLNKLQTLINFPANACDVSAVLRLTSLRKLVLNDPRYFKKFGEIFKHASNTLNCLQSLSLKSDILSLAGDLVDVSQLVSGCPRLLKLHVEGLIQNLPEYHQFSPYLTKLTLWGSRLVEDPMATLEKLPKLMILSGWEVFVGKKMVCSNKGFPELKSLFLRGLPNLEEWTVEEGAMHNLCRLGISDCNKLKATPDGLRFVTTLQELEIRMMPREFKKRLEKEGDDFFKVQHVPSILFLN